MGSLVQSWSNGRCLPETYVLPPEERPGKHSLRLNDSIPIIDLRAQDRTSTVNQILKASQEFGFFQVLSHGVSEELMDDVMRVIEEFHAMPAEEKVRECSKDPSQSCKIYTSSETYETESSHYWRDVLTHPCLPLETSFLLWPEKPDRYREVIAWYVKEMSSLGYRILELISEGLGLGCGSLRGEVSEAAVFLANHYPACPDPSLTLGIPGHCDPSLITILLQRDYGLQVCRDNVWFDVQPLPRAFVINVGRLLQIISNDNLVAAEHRVLTNSRAARTTAAFFIYPSDEFIVRPLLPLTKVGDPPLYKPFKFKDFFKIFKRSRANADAIREVLGVCNKRETRETRSMHA